MIGNWRSFPLFALLAAALLAGGCATQGGISDWQKSVEQYIQQEANGDPNALRDLPVGSSHRGFAVLGNSNPENSTDANGVLVGHRPIGGRHWFIFLVGVVEKRDVTDIRVAAMTPEGGQFRWVVGPQNPTALAAYRRARQSALRTMNSDPKAASVLGFPTDEDAFLLDIAGSRVVVTHPASGAQWTATLPAGGATAQLPSWIEAWPMAAGRSRAYSWTTPRWSEG